MTTFLPIFIDYIDYLDRRNPRAVLPWACPVPYFGAASEASIATVGINPSNLEFMDSHGRELEGHLRRLPTLRSLGISSWANADSRHVGEVVEGCNGYFISRPYNRWFGVLERVLGMSSYTFYGERPSACHIDLVAFTTTDKWSTLSSHDRRSLLEGTRHIFAQLIKCMPIQSVVLNGISVVRAFEASTGVLLDSTREPSWDLQQSNGVIRGISYVGSIDEFAGVMLGRTVMVKGFNHNLQSSFGITSSVIDSIGTWLASEERESS